MKKFLIDVLIFTALLFLVLLLLKKTVPFYWGNDLMGAKIQHLLETDTIYDSFFIGSSKTYRHIDPETYDEITGRNSFNLGSKGMFPLEMHYILDKFSRRYPHLDGTHYFLQNLLPNKIADRNLHSIRSKYYMDFKRMKRGVNHFAKRKDYDQLYNHSISYIENQLCIGEVFPILTYHFSEREFVHKKVMRQKGYFSLTQELKLSKNAYLKKRKKAYRMAVKRGEEKKMTKSNIKIREVSKEELNISNSNHKINFYQILGTPVVNHNLYFDRGHLSAQGAEFYTKQISEYVKNNIIK